MTLPPQPDQPQWDPNNPPPGWEPAKPKRPFYKKKRYILPAAVVALIVAFSPDSEEPSTEVVATESAAPAAAPAESEAAAPAPAAPAEPTEAPAPPSPAAPEYVGATDDDTAVAAGQPIELSGWTTTATPLVPASSDLMQEVLCSDVTLVNNDDEQQEYSSLSWKLQYPNGSVLDMTYTGDNDLGNVGGAGLAAGGSVTQKACFEDTGAGPGQYILSWQPDVFSSSKRGVWLNTL